MAGEVSLIFYSAMLFIVFVWAAVISRQTIVLINEDYVHIQSLEIRFTYFYT